MRVLQQILYILYVPLINLKAVSDKHKLVF